MIAGCPMFPDHWSLHARDTVVLCNCIKWVLLRINQPTHTAMPSMKLSLFKEEEPSDVTSYIYNNGTMEQTWLYRT